MKLHLWFGVHDKCEAVPVVRVHDKREAAPVVYGLGFRGNVGLGFRVHDTREAVPGTVRASEGTIYIIYPPS